MINVCNGMVNEFYTKQKLQTLRKEISSFLTLLKCES